jgi:hypothetical protein
VSDDATEAREYIALFRKYTLPGADEVRVTGGRIILLDDMTDADAIFVAREFRDMEAQAAKSRRHRPQ